MAIALLNAAEEALRRAANASHPKIQTARGETSDSSLC